MLVKGAKFPKWGKNFLGNLAPQGPYFLENLARGGQIFGGAKFPVTPAIKLKKRNCKTGKEFDFRKQPRITMFYTMSRYTRNKDLMYSVSPVIYIYSSPSKRRLPLSAGFVNLECTQKSNT